jgi:UDPglucose 6-dehydrogenase
MNPTSAELTKYVANVMLANRISLMNEMSELCDRVGANIEQVRVGVGADRRIGHEFLKAGLGYGGSCFPKDIQALNSFAKKQDLQLKITSSIEEVNTEQLARFARKIISFALESDSKCVTLWGASFKPETNDLRESPALKLTALLKQEGLKVQIYDPVCGEQLKALFQEPSITVFSDKYESLRNSSALVICTEWPEFVLADKLQIKQTLLVPVVFDGRNIFEPIEMKNLGFIYSGIGRNS